jgi:glutathione S-transferase
MTLPQPVRLYDQPRAPNPRRLNIFLAEKGLDVPRLTLDLMAREHKAPEFVRRVGVGQVPALELDDGAILTETQAICRYVEALAPEPNMMGREPLEQAVIEMWQRRVEFGLFHAVAMTFRHTNPHLKVLETQIPEYGAEMRSRIAPALDALNARLDGRDWIAVERMTVADITAFIAVDFMRVIKYSSDADRPYLNAWVARMTDRPSTRM